MGSTNFTPNYNLPQFIGTDKPAWLTDVNGAFSNIDTAIKNAADAASAASSTAGSASSTATAAANAVNTLDTQINTPATGLAAVVSENTSDIAGVVSQIGNVPLTTVAQTLTGAIEEVKAGMPDVTGALKYVGTHRISVASDGTKTIGNLIGELYTAILAYLATKDASYRFVLQGVGGAGVTASWPNHYVMYTKDNFNGAAFDRINMTSNAITITAVDVVAAGVYRTYNGSTVTDQSASTASSGDLALDILEYAEL